MRNEQTRVIATLSNLARIKLQSLDWRVKIDYFFFNVIQIVKFLEIIEKYASNTSDKASRRVVHKIVHNNNYREYIRWWCFVWILSSEDDVRVRINDIYIDFDYYLSHFSVGLLLPGRLSLQWTGAAMWQHSEAITLLVRVCRCYIISYGEPCKAQPAHKWLYQYCSL